MDQVRTRIDAYCEAVERERFRLHRGDTRALDLDRIGDQYGDITDGAALSRVRSEFAAAGAPWKEGWRRFAGFVEGLMVAAHGRRQLGELLVREAVQRGNVGATARAVFTWWRRRGTVTDSVERRRIQEVLDDAWLELSPLRREHHCRLGEAVHQLGYVSFSTWHQALEPTLDGKEWVARATHFLELTELVYHDRLTTELRAIGVDPRRARPSDLSHIARLDRHADLFPDQRLDDGLDFTIEGLGQRIDDLPIAIDRERRPGKNPRAACFSPRIPGEQRLVIGLRGGVGDLRALLHTLGVALAQSFVSSTLAVERRRAIDPTLLETWGLLLRQRVSDPAWIAQGPPSRVGEVFARDVQFVELMELRRIAAMVRWEDALYSLPAGADPQEVSDLYAEELTRATGSEHRPGEALLAGESRPRAIHRFRAACLEAQISEHLRANFGERFFGQRAAFDFLKELWNTGGTYRADELASEVGVGPIGVDLLLKRLFEGVR